MAKSPIESEQQLESQNPPELEAPLLHESIVEGDSSLLSTLRPKMAEGLIWHKVAALSDDEVSQYCFKYNGMIATYDRLELKLKSPNSLTLARQTCKRDLKLCDVKSLRTQGMAAIGLGTYGAHIFKPANPVYRDVWQSASVYHLVHTAALLAAPITKRPHVFGGLLTFGIVAFSGSCYVTALYEDKSLSLPAPFGGFAFLGAWASLLL